MCGVFVFNCMRVCVCVCVCVCVTEKYGKKRKSRWLEAWECTTERLRKCLRVLRKEVVLLSSGRSTTGYVADGS
jgi:hypothetical protein